MSHRNPRQAGFSLVEVMVALIVVSIGMLGIAKMQALALASTSTARMRSLASITAASLGSAMHANRAYWGSTVTGLIVTVTSGGAVSSTQDTGLNTTRGASRVTCTSITTPCTAVKMAAKDLGDWADNVYAVSSSTSAPIIPNGSTVITCNPPVLSSGAVAGNPGSCQIVMTWTENRVASDTGRVTGSASNTDLLGTASTSYTLWVDP